MRANELKPGDLVKMDPVRYSFIRMYDRSDDDAVITFYLKGESSVVMTIVSVATEELYDGAATWVLLLTSHGELGWTRSFDALFTL